MDYSWQILQHGRLPLRPDGTMMRANGHRCTALLLWPHGEQPGADNTLIIDPCFNQAGAAAASAALRGLRISWGDLGSQFVTHGHQDHQPALPNQADREPAPWRPGTDGPFNGIRLEALPGHDRDQHAIVFRDGGGEVWVTGDAVLDQEWLISWAYYWPNKYDPEEVAETWRSVARVVSHADLVVPGHGAPFRVTATLVEELLEGFDRAEHADLCPEVRDILRQRLVQLEA